jgi:phosphate transport system substrate-binding protein
LVSLTCAVLLAGCGFALTSAVASAATISGDGSTLVAPLATEWGAAWGNATGNTVTYQSVGSGQGIKDISNRLVDFGASDAPLTPAQFSSCGGCVQIPWALSAVGVGYHLSGIHKLHLTGTVIAAIWLGQITNWSDPRIAKLNRGVHLPNLKITPLYRTDGSGTTYAFTNYLSDISGTWAHQVGYSTTVSFPTGVGGKGNAGVVAILDSTNGAISYNEVAYLIAHREPAAAVKNAASNYEYPNLTNIANAARSIKSVPSTNEMHIVNPARRYKIAYPISTFTYAIVPTNAPQGALLKQFIGYALTGGQALGPRLDFSPIPRVVLNASQATLSRIS